MHHIECVRSNKKDCFNIRDEKSNYASTLIIIDIRIENDNK